METLEQYRKRENVLGQVREALEANDTFDKFLAGLERRGLSESRIHQVVNPPVGADFHLHSNYSDGRLEARKLAWLARVIGLRMISLADHDSISGCREIYREGTLLGVTVIPAVELSTGRSGCEILVYFPIPGQFFGYLSSSKSVSFVRFLKARQTSVHQVTLKVLDGLNVWLKRRGIGEDQKITIDEVDRWFGGREPYYPGTLCVIGLKRLSADARKELGISNPRAFNTKVVTPMLSRLGYVGRNSKDRLPEVFRQVRALRRAGAAPVTILSHPKELITKGKLSLGRVAKFTESLVRDYGIDGVEVACARDTKTDVRYWVEMASEINRKVERGDLGRRRKALIMSSYSSDFHVLAPGLATGEITIGFGMLDERREHRRGNLCPIGTPEEFLEAMKRRAASKTGSRV